MPRIIEITASSGTSFNHPYESYSNFKPSITLKAVVGEHEDPIYCIQNLQRQAHDFVTAEKDRIMMELERENEIERCNQTIESVTREIAWARGVIADGPARLKALEEGSWEHSDLKQDIERAQKRLPESEAELAKTQARLEELRG
jgi:predicted  nucleic acid-binding Zn-ribbon protein